MRNPQKRRVGELLLERGLLEKNMLNRALNLQRAAGGRLGLNLLEIGAVSESNLLRVLGSQSELSIVTVDELRDIPESILRSISEKTARRLAVVPFRLRGNTLCVASAQPLTIDVENDLATEAGRLVRPFLALDVRVYEALNIYYEAPLSIRLSNLLKRMNRDQLPHDTQPVDVPPELSQASIAQPTPSVSPFGGPNEDGFAAEAAHRVSQPIIWDRNGARSISMNHSASALEPDHPSAIIEEENGEAIEIVPEPTVDVTSSPTPRLTLGIQDLAEVADVERTAELLLGSCSDHFVRRLLLAYRSGRVRGWKADGRGIVPRHLTGVDFATDQCPPFLSIEKGARFWLGPLGAGAAAEQLNHVLGDRPPSECLILPSRVGDRTVAFLYLDNGGAGVAGSPLGDLLELTREAGHAMERALLKSRATAN